MEKVKISELFVVLVKLDDRPAWRICQEAGVCATALSKILHGAISVRRGDRRVIAVGSLLGLKPSQCFENDRGQSE